MPGRDDDFDPTQIEATPGDRSLRARRQPARPAASPGAFVADQAGDLKGHVRKRVPFSLQLHREMLQHVGDSPGRQGVHGRFFRPRLPWTTYTHLLPSSDQGTRKAVDDAFACYISATSDLERRASHA